MLEIRKYCAVVACCLIQTTSGIPYFIGNLLTYVVSYLFKLGLYDQSNIGDGNWAIAPFGGMYFLGSLSGGFLHTKLKIRKCLFVAAIINVSGHVLTFYTIQHGVWAIIGFYGSLSGLAGGMAYSLCIHLAQETFPNRVGTATSIVVMGLSLGGIVMNQVITLLVNPENYTPDVQLKQYRLFNQTEITAKVPGAFLIMGGMVSCIQLIGILLAFSPLDSYEKLTEGISKTADSLKLVSKDYTPTEVLKDPQMYILWCMILFCITVKTTTQLEYKNFAQTFIYDDHFLALVGSSVSLASTIARLVQGMIADILGIKMTYLITFIPGAIFMFTFHETIHLPRIWYLIWCNVVNCAVSIVPVLSPVVARQLYGSKYFIFNFSIIWSACTIATAIGPLLVKILLPFGWYNLFLLLGGLLAACTVLTLLLKLPLFPNWRMFSCLKSKETKQNES